VIPRHSQLPDLRELSRAVRAASDQFRVRGVEAVVDGRLACLGGHVVLRIGGTGAVLRLVPLRHKVQWDRQRKREASPTEIERLAFRRLLDRGRGFGRRVRVVGPVVVTAEAIGRRSPASRPPGQPPLLQVRQFSWGAKPSGTAAAALSSPR
jgi:hypothetical protein